MARRTAGRKIYAHAKLRRLRREHGMNQVDMARALGISTSYANQIEQGQRPLTAPVLLRIAEVFGVDAQFFSEPRRTRRACCCRARNRTTRYGTSSTATTTTSSPWTRRPNTRPGRCGCGPAGPRTR